MEEWSCIMPLFDLIHIEQKLLEFQSQCSKYSDSYSTVYREIYCWSHEHASVCTDITLLVKRHNFCERKSENYSDELREEEMILFVCVC